MSNRIPIVNWLGVTFSQDPSHISEDFYFDQKNQIFFSIHAVDFFMLGEDREVDPDVRTSYATEDLNKLVDWMKRVDRDDPSIVYIHRKGIKDDIVLETEANKFIQQNHVDLEKAVLWQPGDTVSIHVDLTKETPTAKAKKWWQFWKV